MIAKKSAARYEHSWRAALYLQMWGSCRHKKNAALVCAAFGFPVYNLMKSLEPVVNVSAASLLAAAVIFH
jgi:hypothetical protein